MAVFDVGGGAHPLISPARKDALRLHVTGVDLSPSELESAPAGAYDRTIVADIADLEGRDGEADMLYSRSVVEHVTRPERMFENTLRILRPGGLTVHFIPSQLALFALANAALPHRLSRWLLTSIYPETEARGIFPSYYRGTYPAAMRRMLRRVGYAEVEFRCYYAADYLSFFLPAHVGYATWQNLNRWLGNENLCESFVVFARKPSS